MITLILGFLGLCFGSFINALVYRLHWQESHKEKNKKYSIINGRSRCPSCKHELTTKDLIPVVSWLWLGGRCRYCKKPISPQYPLVEALTGGLFVLSYELWPVALTGVQEVTAFITWLVVLVGFVALAVYDLKYQLLPNRIIFPLIILVICSIVLQSILASDIGLIAETFWGAVIGGGLFYLLFQVSEGEWIGGGDVKLGFLIGLVIGGPWNALLMLFIASLLGTLYSLPLMMAKKIESKARIPFGPFLISAAIIIQFYGKDLTEYLQNSLIIL